MSTLQSRRPRAEAVDMLRDAAAAAHRAGLTADEILRALAEGSFDAGNLVFASELKQRDGAIEELRYLAHLARNGQADVAIGLLQPLNP